MSFERICRSIAIFIQTTFAFYLLFGLLTPMIVLAFTKEMGFTLDFRWISLISLGIATLATLEKICDRAIVKIDPNKIEGAFNPLWPKKFPNGQSKLNWYPSGLHFRWFWEEPRDEKLPLENRVTEIGPLEIEVADGTIPITRTLLTTRLNVESDDHINRYLAMGATEETRKSNCDARMKGWNMEMVQEILGSKKMLDVVLTGTRLLSQKIQDTVQREGGLDDELGQSVVEYRIVDVGLPANIAQIRTGDAELDTVDKMAERLRKKFPNMSDEDIRDWIAVLTGQAHLVLSGRGGRGPIFEVADRASDH